MSLPTGPAYPAPPPEFCAFHPDRRTALHCTRCGRPACPECLTPASVGFHCRACVAEARGTQRAAVSVAGARIDQRRPVATYALIAVNVIVYVITAAQAKSVNDPNSSPVFQQGALAPDLVAAGQWWRLLTAGFLHLSVEHIALNMISLYLLGGPLERLLGWARYLVVYFLSLLGGSVAVLLLTGGTSLTAGASGAIFGLMGALFVTFRRLRLDPRQLIIVVVLNLIISFTVPGISWQGHIGGLIVGAAAGAVMVYPPQRIRRAWQLGGSIGIAVLLLIVAIGFAVSHTPQFCSVSSGYFVPC